VKTIAREFPFVWVPEGGLGRRLDDMHAFHRQRGITDHRAPIEAPYQLSLVYISYRGRSLTSPLSEAGSPSSPRRKASLTADDRHAARRPLFFGSLALYRQHGIA
jgi:hypothetical protein